MNHYRTTLLVALSILVVSVGVAEATGKRKCAEDYRRFCSQWGLETRGLQNCMRRYGDYLSKRCIKGLVQAGAVSQAEVNKRRAQIGR